MFSLLQSALSGTAATFGLALLLEVTVKAGAILLVSVAASLALRRASSATRHLLWVAALASTLALPVLVLALPHWSLPRVRLPEFTLAPPAIERPATGAILGASEPSFAMVEPTANPVFLESRDESMALLSPKTDALAGSRAAWRWPDAASLVLAIWLAGVLLALARMAFGRFWLWRLARDARPVADEAWKRLADAAARRLRISRPVALLEGDCATVPMTWGVLRPRVLLPACAREWPRDRVRVVLLHELAHVGRRDCLTQVVVQLACAVYWFHPAVWFAARSLRIERERACDDRVLESETQASDYATHLLAVAQSLRPQPALGALAFARPSQLESRLLAVLDPARNRGAMRPALAAPIVLAAALLCVPLGTLRLWAGSVTTADANACEDACKSAARAKRAASAAEASSAALDRRSLQAMADAADDFTHSRQLSVEARKQALESLKRCTELGQLLEIFEAPTAPEPDEVDAPEPTEGQEPITPPANENPPTAPTPRAMPLAPMPGGAPLPPTPGAAAPEAPAGPDEEVVALQRQAVEALGRMPEGIGLPKLIDVVKHHPSLEVRIEAVGALAMLGTEGALGVVTQLAWRGESTEIQAAAVEALARFPEDVAMPLLVQIAQAHARPEVRRVAIEALSRLDPEKALPLLEEILERGAKQIGH